MCFCKSLEALLLGESVGPGNTGKAGLVRLVEVDHIHFSFCDRLYILYICAEKGVLHKNVGTSQGMNNPRSTAKH